VVSNTSTSALVLHLQVVQTTSECTVLSVSGYFYREMQRWQALGGPNRQIQDQPSRLFQLQDLPVGIFVNHTKVCEQRGSSALRCEGKDMPAKIIYKTIRGSIKLIACVFPDPQTERHEIIFTSKYWNFKP